MLREPKSNRLMTVLPPLLVSMLCLLASPAFAEKANNESVLKAALVYKMIQFVHWPDDRTELALCSWPKSEVANLVTQYANNREYEKSLLLKRISNPGDTSECDIILFFNSRIPNDIQSAISGRPILTISDGVNALQQETMLGITVHKKKLVMHANNELARQSGLMISSNLLRLARSVER